ncbi:cycloartenol-C-24-methyltransferase [Salix suchowensis]|nr:cycloartenol-C-24-methyltransferase [Salix suchowensis]
MAGVDRNCNYVKVHVLTRTRDLLCISQISLPSRYAIWKMPFSDNTFDAIFAIEATCHAPDARDCYNEIYRVLKPRQCFATYEWCITESFDPLNQEHRRIKGEVELGNGLPELGQCLEALQLAGFEVIWEKDVAVASLLPWYLPLDKNQLSPSSFRVTAVGRFITRNMFLHLAPDGSQRVQAFLEKAADAAVEGGRTGIFTPMYFFLARKPLL